MKAVDMHRELAAKRPDAFLPYLARSLNNLGTMLSELGDREGALKATREAVDIRRELVERWPHMKAGLDASLHFLARLQAE